MNTLAFTHNLPCKNPNCKSNGKPHPNCKCYGLAEGGDVSHFCSESRMHKPDCEYFAEGGMSEHPLKGEVEEHLTGQPSEESKWAVGNEDKEEALASSLLHAGAHNLLGGDFKGVYSPEDQGIRGLGNKKISEKLQEHLNVPFNPVPIEDTIDKLTKKHPNKLAKSIVKRMLQSKHLDGFNNLIAYTESGARGKRNIKKSLEGIFSGSGSDMFDINHDNNDRLDDFIKNGKIEDHIKSMGSGAMERVLPEHNMMIQAAKTRINNYLNSLRPVKMPSAFPFDKSADNLQKEKTYKKAVSIANHPLQILDQVRKGSLTGEAVSHFKALYPEGYNYLSKMMTEKIIESQLKDKRPSYSTRQSMSLFLGTPLDSTFTPQSIQAAQATFAKSSQSQQTEQQKPKQKTNKQSLNKMPNQYKTTEQGLVSRQQNAK